jgi:hypothetical protein
VGTQKFESGALHLFAIAIHRLRYTVDSSRSFQPVGTVCPAVVLLEQTIFAADKHIWSQKPAKIEG